MSEITGWFTKGSAPRVHSVTLRIDRVEDESALRARLERDGVQGWVCTTDGVARLGVDAWPVGPLLSAEARDPSGLAINVRQHRQGWTVTEIDERDDGETEALAFDTTHVAVAGGTVHHRVYWTLRDAGGEIKTWQPTVARFDKWRD